MGPGSPQRRGRHQVGRPLSILWLRVTAGTIPLQTLRPRAGKRPDETVRQVVPGASPKVARPVEPSEEKAAHGPGRKSGRQVGADIDLATIAGLARWTYQVVDKVGRDNLEPLMEVSEIRGRLPDEVKAIVLTLARLFGSAAHDNGLTSREILSSLVQLDLLSGYGTADDAKLLPLLMQAEVEDFPLIRP